VWPDHQVLEQQGASPRAREAFQRLFSIFLEEASEDALALMPGHAYFLDHGKTSDLLLRTGLRPLLQEYLLQGYVSGFADSIRVYLDWMDATSAP
jgi:5-methylcytosine-specific restriction protein B